MSVCMLMVGAIVMAATNVALMFTDRFWPHGCLFFPVWIAVAAWVAKHNVAMGRSWWEGPRAS